jgi:hypothetical protein
MNPILQSTIYLELELVVCKHKVALNVFSLKRQIQAITFIQDRDKDFKYKLNYSAMNIRKSMNIS